MLQSLYMRVCGLTASMLESQGRRRKVLDRIRGKWEYLISVNGAEAHVTSAIPALGYPVTLLILFLWFY